MALFEGGGGETERKREPIFLRLHPPVAELTPENLAGCVFRTQPPAWLLFRGRPVANVRVRGKAFPPLW